MLAHTPIDTGTHDARCACGQLVARWTPTGIEIKCKRCRRIVAIPFVRIEGTPPPRR